MQATSRTFARNRTLIAGAAITAVALVLAIGVYAPAPAAQEPQLGLPDKPTNLQVLPADMETGAVLGVMRGFAQALGVRCIHCHLGDDPRDNSTVDFASDARPEKQKARVMMAMVKEINDTHVAKFAGLGSDADALLRVTCATCHHGQSRPRTLGQVLTAAYDEGGIDESLNKYSELREQYYGGWTYDFGEGALLGLARQLARVGDTAAAMALIDRNLELFPESFSSHGTRATILERGGDIEGAKAAYQACFDANPEAGARCKERLDALNAQQ